MTKVLSLIWYEDTHIITARDINTKTPIFEENIKGLADSLIYKISCIMRGNNVDIRTFNYIAISYNLKSYTDIRLYYSIAFSLAQVLKIKVVDISKDAEILLLNKNNNSNEKTLLQHRSYLNSLNEIIESKINKNDFVNILNAKPLYINTTRYKKVKNQIENI